MKIFSLLLSLSVVFSASSFAQQFANWKHINLKSTSGVEISIDYQTDTPGVSVVTTDTWVNVTLPMGHDCLLASDVEMTLNSFYVTNTIAQGSVITPIAQRMAYTGELCKFTAYLGQFEIQKWTDGYGYTTRQELNIKVDGAALIDPVSNTSTFKFVL